MSDGSAPDPDYLHLQLAMNGRASLGDVLNILAEYKCRGFDREQYLKTHEISTYAPISQVESIQKRLENFLDGFKVGKDPRTFATLEPRKARKKLFRLELAEEAVEDYEIEYIADILAQDYGFSYQEHLKVGKPVKHHILGHMEPHHAAELQAQLIYEPHYKYFVVNLQEVEPQPRQKKEAYEKSGVFSDAGKATHVRMQITLREGIPAGEAINALSACNCRNLDRTDFLKNNIITVDVPLAIRRQMARLLSDIAVSINDTGEQRALAQEELSPRIADLIAQEQQRKKQVCITFSKHLDRHEAQDLAYMLNDRYDFDNVRYLQEKSPPKYYFLGQMSLINLHQLKTDLASGAGGMKDIVSVTERKQRQEQGGDERGRG